MYNQPILESYKITIQTVKGSELRTLSKASGGCIPFDELNYDYQKYLKWLAQGNEAEIEDKR
jgi:hypothetical protein